MEIEIEKRLNQKYKGLTIKVEYIKCKYVIKVMIGNQEWFDFPYRRACSLTINENIYIIINMIDYLIIEYFKGGIQ